MNKRMIIDIGMLIILPLLMAYSLIGEFNHEVLGTVIFILFIIHHIYNFKWFKSLNKGKYSVGRIIQITINILLLTFMILQPLSGILMSKHLFTFIDIPNVSNLSRTIHMVLAYWGFVLMCIHAGMHIQMVLVKIKNRKALRIIYIIFAIISIYGIFAFIKRRLYEYMFMRMMFVYFDFSEPLIFFFIDYISIMILFISVGALINKLK